MALLHLTFFLIRVVYYLKLKTLKLNLMLFSFLLFGDQRKHTERRYVINTRKYPRRKYMHMLEANCLAK